MLSFNTELKIFNISEKMKLLKHVKRISNILFALIFLYQMISAINRFCSKDKITLQLGKIIKNVIIIIYKKSKLLIILEEKFSDIPKPIVRICPLNPFNRTAAEILQGI